MAVQVNGYRPEGVMVAAITPFKDDESLDLDRLASHYNWMLDAGVHGIMTIGGCGEFANLTPAERNQVVTETMRVVGGRVPVIVGALAPSTREVIEVGLHAAREGATALLVLPPYYIKPSFQGVIEHYRQVHEATGLDIIVYNNPGRTGWPLGVEHLLELAELPGVVGLKECERDLASISLKIAAVDRKMAVLSGDDDLGYATLLSGARGAIWASPNVHPRLCVDLYTACLEGDLETALGLHNRLVQVFQAWMRPNHPSPMKEMMELVGRPAGPARKPLVRQTAEQLTGMREVVAVNGPLN